MAKLSYSKWTPQEVELIRQEIEHQRTYQKKQKISWIYVSEAIKTKTPRQCFDWYQIRYSRDSESAHQWTGQEINRLRELKAQGMKTREICAHFQGMSVSQVRNKLRYILKEQPKAEQFDLFALLQQMATK